MINLLKDLISIIIFVISLYVLYRTQSHHLALLMVLTIISIYAIKHIRLKILLNKDIKNKIQVFKTMFNASDDLITYQDLDKKIVACNDSILKMFGIHKQEIIGKTIKSMLEKFILDSKRGKRVMQIIHDKIDKAVKTKKSIKFFENFQDTEGKMHYFNLLVSPICNENNEISGSIIVARDVTNEYLATKEAKEKGEQLKCILENMPYCAFLKDKSGYFIIGSSTFENVIENNNSTISDVSVNDVFQKDYIDYVEKEEAEIYRTKKTLVVEREVVLNNQSFWGRIRKTPILDKNGNVKYLVVMYENIEAEKEMQRQKEYFIETLIHDLKIPTLAQLRGLELIKNETIGKINSDQHEMVSQIENSCKYILEMISMVLKTYCFENGTKKMLFEIIELNELFLESFEDLDFLAKEKELKFVYHALESNIQFEADKSDIKTLLVNLLSNSIMYAQKNSDINIKVSRPVNQIMVEITSQGGIFSEEECKTMFEKGNKDTPKYSTIGHGISLYLCKKIIESHCGQIYASTDGKEFSTLKFVIPIKQRRTSSSNIYQILS